MIVDVNVNARESRLPRRNVTHMARGGSRELEETSSTALACSYPWATPEWKEVIVV